MTQRLEATASRRDGRVRLRVSVRLRNGQGRPVVRVLRVGRCTSGGRAYPTCPSAFALPIRIPPVKTVSLTRTVTLREPPARLDAVQVVVTRGGLKLPYVVRDVNARLLLRGQAWRDLAGAPFGVRIDDSYVHRMTMDVAATSATQARFTFRAVGTAASAPGVRSQLSRCNGDSCSFALFGAQRGYSSGNQIGVFRTIERQLADTVGTQVIDPGGQEALHASLPWPTRPAGGR